MTVAYDAVGPSGGGGASSTNGTLTWSHTCGSTATILVVGVAAGANNDADIVTSATYAGTPMTSVAKVHTNNVTSGYLEVFYLMYPTKGSAQNVTITASGGTQTPSLEGGSVSYSGVYAVGTNATNYDISTQASVTISSATGNMVYVAYASGSSFTGSWASGTRRWQHNLNNATGAGNAEAGDFAGASSVSCASGTISPSSDYWAAIAVNLLPGPTLVYSYGAAQNVTNTAVTSTSFTPQVGDLVVVKAISEDPTRTYSGNPTSSAGSLSFGSPKVSDTTSSYAPSYIWVAEARAALLVQVVYWLSSAP